MIDAVRHGIRTHYQRAMDRKRFEPNNVRAGRACVAAYVAYIHYVERLYQAATGAAHGHYREEEHGSGPAHTH